MAEDETGSSIAPTRRGAGQFARLWAASALSNLGDGVALVAAPLLAASLTRDPALVAGLAFTQRLPWLLFALVSGALADRLDRRRAMVGVAIFRALLIGGLGLSILLDRISLPLLYIIFFLLSTGETLFDTAAVTVLPSIVPRDELPEANARLAGTLTVTNQFVGPPLGGFLFASLGALPFLAGGAALATASALLAGLRGSFRSRHHEGASSSLVANISEGIRWLRQHRLLWTIAIALALLNVTVVAQVSIMVLFAQERLGLSPAGYGILVATYGVGGVLGSLVAGRVIGRLGASRVLRLAIVVETMIPALIALSGSAILVGGALMLFGAHAIIWGALLSSLRQELIPDRLRGRVESVYRLIEYGGAAPGALLGGWLATHFGLASPFWLGAFVGALILPVVWPIFSDATITSAREQAEHER